MNGPLDREDFLITSPCSLKVKSVKMSSNTAFSMKWKEALSPGLMASHCPGSDYFDSMNAILHPTLKTAILVLRIRTKDPTLTTNYRPISLLSIHYKLASCAITQRDKPRMTDLIGRQQKLSGLQCNIDKTMVTSWDWVVPSSAQAGFKLILLLKDNLGSLLNDLKNVTYNVWNMPENTI